jgi:oligoendopeptidase F
MRTYQSRLEVPEQEKWNLSDIYSDMNIWEEDFQQIEKTAIKLKDFDGSIYDGKSLFQFLKESEELSFKFNHLYAFSMLRVDEDTRDSHSQSLLERAKSLSVKISSSRSFFMPFLLSLEEATLKGYIAEEPGLKYFEEDLFDSFR